MEAETYTDAQGVERHDECGQAVHDCTCVCPDCGDPALECACDGEG